MINGENCLKGKGLTDFFFFLILTGNHFTWRKVTTTVHNIIVGKLWVDQSGEMDITNHVTGDKCHLKFIPYSYFSRETQRKVNEAFHRLKKKCNVYINVLFFLTGNGSRDD